MKKKNKSLEKFVQMGSSAEYGKLKGSQKETVNCETKSIYGLAKLKTTKYLMSQFKKMNFPVAILRLYQAYGPNQDINRLIPIAIEACKKNKSFNCSTHLVCNSIFGIGTFILFKISFFKDNSNILVLFAIICDGRRLL